jgi:hypothetical protein
MKTIINCETGEVIVRELNKAEIDQQKVDEAQIAKLEAKLKAETKVKDDAKAALLNKLGITAEEAALLLS